MIEKADAAPSGPKKVGIREFRGNLPNYLRQVRTGASFLLTSHGEVVAVLQPPNVAPAASRRPGALRGKIVMAPDFDVMPDDLLSAMEDGHV